MAKWTEEMRKAASEKMKAQWANGKMGKKKHKKQRAPKVRVKKGARRPEVSMDYILIKVLKAYIHSEVKVALKEAIHL